MRRIADFLEIGLTEEQWAACVERCGFAYMRDHSEMVGDFEPTFEGGTKGFIYKGTNERWRGVLDQSDLDAYTRHVRERLPPDAIEWMEHGRKPARSSG